MARKLEPEEVARHSEALAAIVRDMAQRERELRALEQEVECRRAEAAESEAAVAAQLMRLDERREAIEAADTAAASRFAELEEWERSRLAAQAELETRERELTQRERELAQARRGLERRKGEQPKHAALRREDAARLDALAQELAAVRAQLATDREVLEELRRDVRETLAATADLRRALAGTSPRLVGRGGPGCNYEQLADLVAARAAEFPDRAEEWRSYLYYLREFADASGALPTSLEPLVREVFAPVLDD